MTNQQRAEEILYRWACEEITTHNAKQDCGLLGFTIDFRQPDLGNFIIAETPAGHFVELEI